MRNLIVNVLSQSKDDMSLLGMFAAAVAFVFFALINA